MPHKDPAVLKRYKAEWRQRRKVMAAKPCEECARPCSFGVLCRPCSKTGARNHNWNGGSKVEAHGYVVTRTGGKYRKEHILVMEKIIGRRIKRPEMVHHCDEDRMNNDPANLQFFRHFGAHTRLHHFARRHGIKVGTLRFEQPWLCPPQ